MIHFTRRRTLRLLSTWVVLSQLLAIGAPMAYANPQGGVVTHGSASISEAGAVMTIHQSTDKAIINWQGFSNAAGETVRFQQPAASSATLNRVTGNERSVIDGAMQSNGRVYLLNPNGVVFGKTANVNTGGLVASTLQMTDDDFKSGNHRLQQDPTKPLRAVVNQGTITGGSVALVAPIVNNEGVISAPSGKVALAAGTKAVVTMDDQGLVSLGIRESAPGNVVVSRDAVSSVLEQAVNNRHLVDAGSATQNANGEIELGGAEGIAMNQGRIDAAAVTVNSSQLTHLAPGSRITAPGGSVHVLGQDKVGVFDGATVSANGRTGGGTVLVGGDRRGEGPVRTARATYVAAGATVSADAEESGDGGTVVAYGKDYLRVDGKLSARGGEVRGNGGFVETSAGNFDISSTPDVTATNGTGGTWLIDPRNVTIVAGSGNTGITAVSPFTPNADDAMLGVGLIQTALTGGATVQVTTVDAGGAQTGNLVWNSDATLDIEGKGTNGLHLFAEGTLTFNGIITDSVPGTDVLNILFQSNNGVAINGTINNGGGSFTSLGTDFDMGRFDLGGGMFRYGRITAGAIAVQGTNGANQLRQDFQATGENALIGTSLHVFGNAGADFLAADNSVGTLAVKVDMVNGFNYKDADALIVGSLTTDPDAVIGGAMAAVTANGFLLTNADGSITTGASLELAKSASTGTGGLVLTVSGGGATVTQTAGDDTDKIIAGNLSLQGNAAYTLTELANDVVAIQSTNTVTSINYVNSAAGGDLTIGAGQMLQTASGAANAISVTAQGIVFANPLNAGVGLATATLLATGTDINGALATDVTAGSVFATAQTGRIIDLNTVVGTGGTISGKAASNTTSNISNGGTVQNILVGAFSGTTDIQITAGTQTARINAGTATASNLGTANLALDLDSGALTVNAVTTSGTLSIDGEAGVTQGGAFDVGALLLRSTNAAGTFTITNAGNVIPVLAANTNGTVEVSTTGALSVGSVTPVGGGANVLGITTSADDVSLKGSDIDFSQSVTLSGGDLGLEVTNGMSESTQSAGSISAAGLVLKGPGSFTLTQAANNVSMLAGSGTGVVQYTDASGFTIDSVTVLAAMTDGLSSAGNANIILKGTDIDLVQSLSAGAGKVAIETTAAGSITQPGAGAIGTLTAGSLHIFGLNGASLSNPNNSIGTIAVAVGTVNGVNISSMANVTIGSLTTGATTTDGISTRDADVVLTISGTLQLDRGINTDGPGAGTPGSVGLTVTGATAMQNAMVSTDAIIATNLGLEGTAAYTFTEATNDVATVRTNNMSTTASVDYVDSNAVAIGVGGNGLTTNNGDARIKAAGITIAENVNLGNGDLQLDSSAAVTQNGGKTVIASGLALTGTGSVTLNEANNVARLAALNTGNVQYTDTNTFTVDAVTVFTTTTTGINTPNRDVTLKGTDIDLTESLLAVGGNVSLELTAANVATQVGGKRIDTSGLVLRGPGAFTLTDPTNNIANLAGTGTGAVRYVDVDSFGVFDVTVNTVMTSGLASAGGANLNLTSLSGTGIGIDSALSAGPGIVTLNSTGGVADTAVITAASVLLLGAGAFVLDQGHTTANPVINLAANVNGAVTFVTDKDLVVNTVNNGVEMAIGIVSTGNNVNLTANGGTSDVLFSQALNAGAGTATIVAGQNIESTQGAGSVNIIAANATLTGGNEGGQGPSAGAIGAGADNIETTVAGILTLTADAVGAGSIVVNNGTSGTLAALNLAVANTSTGATIVVNTGDTLTLTGNAISGSLDGTNLTFTSITGALAVGAGGLAGGAGSISLSTVGAITDTGALTTTGSLTLLGTGATTLDNAANNVGALAVARGANAVTFTDADGFNVGVGATGIAGSSVNLTAGGAVTQSAGIVTAGTLTLAGAGASWTLLAPNDVATLTSAGTGAVSFVNVNALDVAGLASTGSVFLTVAGALSQSGALTATGFSATAAGITLLSANDVDTLALNSAGALAFTDTDGFAVDTVNGVAGVTAGGNATLTANAGAISLVQGVNAGANAATITATTGSIAGAGTITAGGTTLSAASGIQANLRTPNLSATQTGAGTGIALTNTSASAVSVTALQASGAGSIGYTQTGGGASSFAAVSTQNGAIVLVNTAGSITLNGNLNAGNTGAVTVNGTGVVVGGTIEAGASSVSINAGSGAITGAGRANGGTAVLTSGAGVGSAADPFDTTVAALSASAGSGGVFIAETDGVTVGSISAPIITLTAGGAVVAGVMSAAGGTVTLSTSGAITDGNGAGVDITALTANLTGSSIGSAADLLDVETGGATLNATALSGGVFVRDPSALVAGSVQANGGDVVLSSGGAMTLTGVSATGSGSFTAGGALNVTSVRVGGSAALTSGGNILGSGLVAGAVVLDAAGVIGTTAQPFGITASSLIVDADSVQGGVSVNVNGSLGSGRPVPGGDGLPANSLGLFNGTLFFPDVGQGNASIALSTTGVASVGLRVFDAGQFTLGSDLIAGDEGDGSEDSGDTSTSTSGGTADSSSTSSSSSDSSSSGSAGSNSAGAGDGSSGDSSSASSPGASDDAPGAGSAEGEDEQSDDAKKKNKSKSKNEGKKEGKNEGRNKGGGFAGGGFID